VDPSSYSSVFSASCSSTAIFGYTSSVPSPTILFSSPPTDQPPRWFSLFTVIVGVSLVGFSGSLVKDAAKNDLMTFLDPNTTETSESTKVVLGKSDPTELSAHTPPKTRAGIFFVLFAQLLLVVPLLSPSAPD